MAKTEITLLVPVSIVFDDATTTAAASVDDLFQALAEAGRAGFLDRPLIDISYGRPDEWTAAPAADSGLAAALTAAAAALPDGALDDLVHDVASQEASDINNGGPDSQSAFLARMLGPAAALAEITGLSQDDGHGDRR